MVNFDNFIVTSGVILTILISATVISYTSKFIFFSDKLKKSTNQMYDPDHGLNTSHICILSKDAYVTLFERSPCFNKTLVQWYNPWVRHSLWTEFWNKIRARNRLKLMTLQRTKAENLTENLTQNETVLPTDLPPDKKNEVQKPKEKPIEFVYSILVGLLLLSGVIACWEVFKDKLKRNDGAAAKAQERQCSLADFTINRHLRRETQQQAISNLPKQGSLELTAKVTQNLIHQSSLDRAFPKTISEGISSLKSRRNSMPSYFVSDTPVGYVACPTCTSTFKSAKRQSVDVVGKEFSSELRKKSRHFIRRH